MSRVAKATFYSTCVLSVVTVVGVHYIQRAEKAAMHAGVIRDVERQRLKHERQVDFEMQAALEKELRKSQDVVNTTAEVPEGGAGIVGIGAGGLDMSPRPAGKR